MPTIAVTGSTGALGSPIMDRFLNHRPASKLVAFARDSAKAEPVRTKVVEAPPEAREARANEG